MTDPFANVEPRYVATLEDALMILEKNARETPPEKAEAVAAILEDTE